MTRTTMSPAEITNFNVETALTWPTNFTSSPIDVVKNELAEFCKSHLAVGNERDARTEELSLDGTTVHYRVWIRSKHKTNGITIYSVTYEIKGDIDLANPESVGENEICVNTPVGNPCVKVKDIVAILLALL